MRLVLQSAATTLLGVLALGLGIPTPVSAQNLVVNPDFDDPLQRSSWLETGDWSSADWQDDPGSGSLQITNSFSSSVVLLARQCVPIVAGRAYQVEGRVRAAPDQFVGSTGAALSVGWWTASDCSSGTSLGTMLVGVASETGDWERIGPTNIVAPSGAAGANVRLQVLKGEGSGSFSASFDAISLPESSALSSGLAAVTALASLHRRRRKRASGSARTG